METTVTHFQSGIARSVACGLCLASLILISSILSAPELRMRYLIATAAAIAVGAVGSRWGRKTALRGLLAMNDISGAVAVATCVLTAFVWPMPDHTPLIALGAAFFGATLETALSPAPE